MTLDRTKPPIPSEPRPFKFPKYIKTTVLNGIPLLIVENHTVPLASLQLVFGSGSTNESMLQNDISGLANFTSETLLSGTKSRTTLEIADEIDFLGARLDTNCGKEDITISVSSLVKYLDKCVEIMADITINPSFPAQEIDREKKQAIASILQNKAESRYLSSLQFRKEIFGNNAYGRSSIGDIESISSISNQDCINFHKSFFTPDNAFFVASGDVTEIEIKSIIEKYFKEWKGEKIVADSNIVFPERNSENSITLVHRANSVQSSLRIGLRIFARNNPDYLAFKVLNTLIGGYFDSRLNRNLREKNGFTYGVNSMIDCNKITGLFGIHSQVGSSVTSAAVSECLKEFDIINNQLVPKEELDLVKNYLIGSQSLNLETSEQVAWFVRNIAIYNLDEDYYQDFPNKIRATTSEHLLELTNKYIPTTGMHVVVCGNADSVYNDLSALGKVQVVDAD